jgi:hypothetical protein
MSKRLFQVQFKVRFSPDHPLYWELQFGGFYVFITDAEPERALERAEMIISQLPYERIGGEPRISEITEQNSQRFPKEFQDCFTQARSYGASFFMVAARVGVDEGDFEKE